MLYGSAKEIDCRDILISAFDNEQIRKVVRNTVLPFRLTCLREDIWNRNQINSLLSRFLKS